jgi:hypothetical protein
MHRKLIFILAVLFSINCSAQSICDSLKHLKQKYYGFKPFGYTEEQLKTKSAQLDKFWDLAMSHKDEAGPCLKDMVLAENNDSYFCFDAASLLVKIDEDKYLDAALEGVKKSDLKDLQLEPYLDMVYFLGRKGKDISSLTEKLISYPNAQVPLTMHAIILSAPEASLFLYNTMGVPKAEQCLISSLSKGNPTARQNAAVVLTILSTTKGDSVINAMIANKQLADSTIQFVQKIRTVDMKSDCEGTLSRDELLNKLKSDMPDFTGSEAIACSAFKNLKTEDADLVRAARERVITGLSDESLERYVAATRILIAVRYKQVSK